MAFGRSNLWLGVLAMLGVEFFLLAAVVLQFLRSDYDWVAAPLSFYLLGTYSGWLIGGYFTLAAGIVLLAVGLYRDMAPAARGFAPLLLFAIGALGVGIVALVHSDMPDEGHGMLHGLVHNIAAATAFLCVTTAMLVQAWRFRRDEHWRRRFPRSFALAAATFVALWVYALWRSLPRGAAEKTVILLVVLWLMQTARWLMLRGFAPPPDTPYHHHNDTD